jgi:Predicted nucleotide-binding protein containing TIR -like domain
LVSRSTLGRELADRVERGNELISREIRDERELEVARADYYTWDEYNSQLLRRRFSNDELVDQYRESFLFGAAFEQTLHEKVEDHRDDVRRKVRQLQSIVEQLDLYDEPAEEIRPPAPDTPQLEAGERAEIFVVHGHDEARKLEVATFLEDVTGHRPTILHEQPNEGRTVIEKLEYHAARARLAVVLLTADDEGRRRGIDPLLPRGRQNVVFELGFFAARLTRAGVVLLYESDVELPSDMSGVLYIRLDDAGGWKMTLARELKAVGIDVDMNSAV